MILFPAIDLKKGQCVRLYKGDMERATVFSDDPAGRAISFAAQGCRWLHVVDLDGAFSGKAVNAEAVEGILRAVELPVQLGGGIRGLEAIESWLSRGVSRVVLGTLALRSPEIVREACKKFPGRIAVGVDARAGRVAVEGWAEASDMPARELARRFADSGAAAIVYTDIERDGTLEGLNVAGVAALARSSPVPVVASGGVASLDDLVALKKEEKAGIAGVIVGRALYDKRIDLAEALRVLGD